MNCDSEHSRSAAMLRMTFLCNDSELKAMLSNYGVKYMRVQGLFIILKFVLPSLHVVEIKSRLVHTFTFYSSFLGLA